MLKDGIILEENGERIVFNQYSFCELIKHLLTYYVGISYEAASEMVNQSHLAMPVSSFTDAGLLGHELPYYWAVSLYCGNMFGEKGIPAQPDNLAAYFEVEHNIMKQYHLREPFE